VESLNRLQEILKRKTEIRALLESGQDIDLDALDSEIRELDTEQQQLEKRQQMASSIAGGQAGAQVVARIGESGSQEDTDSKEYRKAFMDYVLRGVRSDALQQRVNATTTTGDIGSVIPETILNQIVEKLKANGMIWNRITKTNLRGGVSIPTSNLKPTATWQGEGTVADKQKKTTGSVIFSYHKLQVRVAVTLEASTVSLDIFEQAIVENIYEAIIVAVEVAVIKGTGAGQPQGIIGDASIPAAQKLDIDQNEIGSYEAWTAIVSNIPLAYEGKVVLTMTKKDWDTHIVGMTDSTGQPIARVTYGISGRPERRFLGFEVILVDDYLISYGAAVNGDVFAFFVDYKDYVLNTNMQLMYKKYFDEDTDEWIDKATLIADGKLKAPHSALLLKKITVV
jgi:HK97 family phage major capsid protein